MRNFALIVLFLFCFCSKAQRIGNYIANSSFEEYDTCKAAPFPIYVIKNWEGLSCSYCPAFLNACFGKVPYHNDGFQYPRSGDGYVGFQSYNINLFPIDIKRTYVKNYMKSTLQAGKTYCVKFYVNVWNGSYYGIDGVGAYFGNSEIDTITKSYIPLTYLTPQVANPQGNIITDTLNWVAITGTFTASGTEKYLLLGNFLSDENTDTLLINSTAPYMYSGTCIDDVSCIPLDLEAYAGRDTTILLGDSVYIGREKDFATDPYCVWYKLPDMTNVIDTISGMWVKPTVTTTYVVRQELECSSLKWDTVVVNVGYVGVGELEIENYKLEIFPNPAQNEITIRSSNESEELHIVITDVVGRKVFNEKLKVNSFVANMNFNLINGAYMAIITNSQGKVINKKLLIAK